MRPSSNCRKAIRPKSGNAVSAYPVGRSSVLPLPEHLLRRPKILLFDEATSNLDLQTAEHFAKTINALKGQVTMLFIAHQIPKGLKLDGVVQIGNPGHGDERHLDIVSETKRAKEPAMSAANNRAMNAANMSLSKQALDFAPSILAIQARPASPLPRVMLYTLLPCSC